MTWASTNYLRFNNIAKLPVPTNIDVVKYSRDSRKNIPEICIQEIFEHIGLAHSTGSPPSAMYPVTPFLQISDNVSDSCEEKIQYI